MSQWPCGCVPKPGTKNLLMCFRDVKVVFSLHVPVMFVLTV